MNENVKYGVVGILSILLTLGGTFLFSPEELENTYVCNLTEQVGVFYGGISSTGLTGYPYLENKSDYVRCKQDTLNGRWIKIGDYARENNLNIESLFTQNQVNLTFNLGRQYVCNQVECIQIN